MTADRVHIADAGHQNREQTVNFPNLFNRLGLDDPSKMTVHDFYSGNNHRTREDVVVNKMLDNFGIDDPEDFATAAHTLADKAKHDHVLLDRSSLQNYSNDKSLTAGERAVATAMHDNFRNYAFASGKPFGGSFITNNNLSIDDKDIAAIDDTAKLLQTARNSPELANPEEFAKVARGLMFLRDGDAEDKYIPEDKVEAIAAGEYGHYNYKSRVVALALSGSNYDKVSSLTKEWNGIDERVVDVVASIGKPKPADWMEKCIAEDHVDVAKAAARSASIHAAAAKKDDKATAALVAGASTAVVAVIHNARVKSNCEAMLRKIS